LIAAEMLSTINKFQNAIMRSEYIRHLSEGLKVQETYLLEELKKIKPLDKHPGLSLPEKKKKLAINPAEKLLIKFMLEEKDVIERIRLELAPTDFQDERTSKIVALIYDLIMQGKAVSPNILINYFDEDDAAELLCESAFMPDLNLQERDKAVTDCIQRLKHDRLKSKRQNLHTQIKNAQAAGDQETLDNLIKEFQDSIKKG